MKIPKATQLPSGSWRTRVRIDGKDITITRNTEEETVAEAMALKAGLQEAKNKAPKDMTLREAIEEYIVLREVALSPATIRGYRIIQENRLASVMDRTINRTTDKMYQLAVNADAKQYSAKTVKNTWCFVASVLKTIAGREVNCAIPQVISKEHEFLEPEHIPVFLKGIKGDPREIPILLALHGLRASEVMDITWKDIDLKKKVIKVRGSAVLDADNNIVHKETNKNSTSRRDVPILIPQLITAVQAADKSSEYVYDKQTVTLYRTINRVCRENGLPEVGVHGLRHSWTSLCFHLGLPAELTQKFGGWGDIGTMKKIYTHLATKDVHKYTAALEAFFDEG